MPDMTPEQPTSKTPRRHANTTVTTADTTGEILVVKPRAPRKPKASAAESVAASGDDAPKPRRTKRAAEATPEQPPSPQPSVIPTHLKRATGPITLSLPAIPRAMMSGVMRTPTIPARAPLADPPTTDLGAAMPSMDRGTPTQPLGADDTASPADSLAARRQQALRNTHKTTAHSTGEKASATDSSKMAAVQNGDATTRNLPAIVTTSAERQVASPGMTRALDHRTDPSLTAYDVTFIPGTHKLTATHTTPRRAPTLHVSSRHRVHRFVLLGVAALILTFAISFVPMARALGLPLARWTGTAAAFALPTATATPAPVYPQHPVVGGEHSFVCLALPFARLAQQQMVQEGMAHPWYVSVILAQWGVEQGWSMPSYTGYNWGNVSAIPGSPAVGGIPVAGSPSAFAYAYTPMQGMEYYVLYVQKGYYTGVTAAYPSGPVAQAVAIGQSPWDADHYNLGGQYGGKLLSAMNTFGLQRFDNPSATC